MPPEVLTGCSLCAYNKKRNGGKSFLERLLVTGSLNGSGMPFFFLVSSRHFFILVQFPVLHQQISLRPCGVALPVVKKFGTSHCASPALRASLVMAPLAGPCHAETRRSDSSGVAPALVLLSSDLLPETDIQTACLLLPVSLPHDEIWRREARYGCFRRVAMDISFFLDVVR